MLSRLLKYYRKIARVSFNMYHRLRLRNRNFSVISKDCIGGILSHDLGVRFASPTVNLWFTAEDFVKFCANLKLYLQEPLLEDKNADMDYPVGVLGTDDKQIRVYFMHYENFQQAQEKWNERAARVNYDNLYFIMTDWERSSEELVKAFDSLPYEHKALLTFRDRQGLKSAVKFRTNRIDEDGRGSPHIVDYKSRFSAKRVLDEWDYVSFFNS